jgi:hypothetical protein
MNNWNRPWKNFARSLALTCAHNGPVKTALGLFGQNIECVREGYRQGLFDASTHLIGVEWEPLVAKKIKKQLNELHGSNYTIYGNDIVGLHPSREPLAGRTVDFAFIDLCGELTADIAAWLFRLMPVMTPGATLSITVGLNAWHNKLNKYICKKVIEPEATQRDVLKIVSPLLDGAEINIRSIDGIGESKYASLLSVLVAVGAARKLTVKRVLEYKDGEHSPMLMVQMQLSQVTFGQKSLRKFFLQTMTDLGKDPYQDITCRSGIGPLSPGSRIKHNKRRKYQNTACN